MKRILIIFLVMFGSGIISAQSGNGGAVGIRIGTGSSGKINVSSEEDPMIAFMIYDQNQELVQSGTISSVKNITLNTNNLPSGVYQIVIVAEDGETSTSTYFKE